MAPPPDCDLELAVLDADGLHALVFPCRRILNGWMNAESRERLDIRPTHWRRWPAGPVGQDLSGRPGPRAL